MSHFKSRESQCIFRELPAEEERVESCGGGQVGYHPGRV